LAASAAPLGQLGTLVPDADLTGANLENAYLEEADLSGADLTGADLRQAEANQDTIWPEGFDPEAAGVIFED
jgi:uncharacterized protein YjbI with pentapeptide repeats